MGKHNVVLYETQVDVLTRFSLDCGIRCGEWLEVSLGEDTDVDDNEEEEKRAQSRQFICDVELVSQWDAGHNKVLCRDLSVQLHTFAEPKWSKLQLLKVVTVYRSIPHLAIRFRGGIQGKRKPRRYPHDWYRLDRRERWKSATLAHQDAAPRHNRT